MEKNSVLRLSVTQGIYDPLRPYRAPSDREISGSGFIINIEKGFVVTSAHVVDNAISIMGRISKLGKRDISLEVLSICREKDLALCKINHNDIQLITRGSSKDVLNDFNFKFGDHMRLKETDEVIAIGYPVGQDTIKYTPGVISGFTTMEDEGLEDSKQRSPTYIQISSRIDRGNSGGPLLNKKGEVVGIISSYSEDFGYAIPSRTFLSIYNSMIHQTIVKVPTLALEWNKTNRELMKMTTGDERTYGIYVRRIYPDCCIDHLESGDIIKRLDYEDRFWNGNFGFEESGENIMVKCYFDRYGDASVGIKKDGRFVKLIDRKVSFAEIMDMIPIGAKLVVEICRDQEWYEIEYNYSPIESDRLKPVFPRIEPVDYEIFAGICCSNLNQSNLFKEKNRKDLYKKRVVICQIFPDTTTYKTQVLQEGQIIKKLNNHKITCLDDIRKILRDRPTEITILTKEGWFFMVQTSTIIPEDKKVIKNFNISGFRYLLNSNPSP